MTDIGERLTELERGDDVSVTVDGREYCGTVTSTSRTECELAGAFMESGYVGVSVDLDAETVDRHGLSTDELSIGAEERGPRAWDAATAMLGESTDLGEVGEVESTNRT